MNQGKLEVVKQEMVRVNINILGISELKWTGMGEFNSYDHCIYYLWARIPQKKWSSPHSQQKESKMKFLDQSQKRQNDLGKLWKSHFQGKPLNTKTIQVYTTTTNAEEVKVEWFYEDLQELLELTPKKRCLLHHRGLECKSRKSRDTWSHRQLWPWCTN